MRYVTIPGAGLSVSALCLGAGGLGTRTGRDDSFRLLDRFVHLGGNFLDTAHIYAAWVPGGTGASERTVGAWLQSRGMARERVVLGTKGGHPHLSSMDVPRLSPGEIRQDLEESLERLRVDTIDLYYLHRDDPGRPVSELLETLAEAARDGKIRGFGVSNWSVPRLRRAHDYAAERGMTGFIANQVGWSLAERNADAGGDPTMRFMDAQTHAFHRETGLLAAAYSSQAGGYFAGREAERGVARVYDSETNRARLERARTLAARRGCAPNDIALGYLISQPFPTCALIGCGTEAHLRASCRSGDVTLTTEEVAWLEEGGTMPGAA